MFIKNKSIEIDDDDIFRNDTLNRKETIIDLSKFIISTTEPFVFSINGSWGTGKTTFVKLWEAYLREEYDTHCLYFSAWEDDFSQEPLISILGELNEYIQDNFEDNSEIKDKFEQAKKFGGKVFKRGVPAFLKGMTAGVLDFDKGVESSLGAISEETAKQLIEDYSKEKEIIEEFKERINDVLNLIDKEQPFIIFIDELDRCRPLYAIELLERIKHIFGIEKLIFVLSIDKTQLSESIKSQYGNIDTDNYLRRFIDLEYKLSNPKIDVFCDVLCKQFELERILNEKGITINLNHHFSFLSIMKKMVVAFDLSLRQVEQIFAKLNILFKIIKPRFYDTHLNIFIFLETLKSYNSNWYYEFITTGKNKEKIKEILLPKLTDEDWYKDISVIIETLVDVVLKNETEYKKLIDEKNKELETIEDTRSSDYIKLQQYINILSYSPDNWGDYTLNKQIDTVIKKIEFLDKFNMENG